ncbi:molybdopterin molybdotransferase MoeA [candidate division TA06 bacterium]|nr:molybdopterin molybdotransferase MoeA [candidate division TA06 bacterium]
MITVVEAREIILKEVTTIGTVSVDLRESSGRVLAEDVVASEEIPPFDNTAMDGYALRAGDVRGASSERPVMLNVVGEVAAGKTSERHVLQGQAMRIMTGAPIPEGADAVVPLERVESNGNEVTVLKEVKIGENVRSAGGDVRPGTLLLKKGRRLKPADLGVLASLGFQRVKVSKQPKVSLLATGDELLDVGELLEPGKIRNSSSYALSSLLSGYGAIPVDLGIAKDRRDEIEEKMREGLKADVLVTIGGVSVGDYDLVQEVLKKMGMEVLFWKVAVKPGKPLLFGRLQDTLVFGLPGNPVSAIVTNELFIKPALFKMMDRKDWSPTIVRATLQGKGLLRKEEREVYVTAVTRYVENRDTGNPPEADGAPGFVTTPTSAQGSSLLTSFSSANSLIILGLDVKGFDKSDKVPVLLLDDWETNSE